MRFIILYIIFFSTTFYAQEFSFQMYFEDATGAKDTLIFGYDANATDSIDSNYGETNIITQQISNSFEVRISDLIWDNLSAQEFENEQINFQLKTQIEKKKCNDANPISFVSGISLYNVTYPVKVKWNKSLFQNSCLSNSFITDWHPSFWFDISMGNEQGPFLMTSLDSIELSYTSHHFINNIDTTDLLFFKLASSQQGFSNVKEKKFDVAIDTYPNPVINDINIELSKETYNNFDNISCKVLNMLGTEIITKKIDKNIESISTNNLPSGLYILGFYSNNQFILNHKFVKQ